MSMVDTTITAETVIRFSAEGAGSYRALRVVLHDEEGKKPRGKAGDGVLLVARTKEETHAELLEQLSGLLKQEGSWEAVHQMFEQAKS